MTNINPMLVRQKGGASIVFVLLMSLVVLASSTKIFKDVKNTQEIGTAVNAVSHAESGTRFAAEAFRLYVQTLSPNAIRTLAATSPVTITTDNYIGALSAENISVVETSTDVFEVNTTLVNRHQASRSSAKLQVVFGVSQQTAGSTFTPPDGTINFAGDLNLSGSVEIVNNGDSVDLVVDGDLDIGNVSLADVNDIYSTGKVTIGSRETVRAIFADDDVELANTEVELVRSRGTVTTSGSARVGIIQANGNVIIENGQQFNQVETRGSIFSNAGGGTLGQLTAGTDIDINGATSIQLAQARGDISYENWWQQVDRTVAMGKVTCASTSWTRAISISAKELNNCREDGTFTTIRTESNEVPLPEEITPITINKPIINVWAIKESANYIVEYDNASRKIMVTVKNVEGLIDGHAYTVGSFHTGRGAPHHDYLCETISGSTCTSPAVPTVPLCVHTSEWNSGCIRYENNTFVLLPGFLAPGVIFFDGNVTMKRGYSYTTVLASGHIRTEQDFTHRAANSGGYSKVCEGDAAHHNSSGVRTRYREAFSKHYPTNLCDKTSGSYIASTTGNIGLAAGGVNPDTRVNPSLEFSGGNIELTNSADVIGAVFAGNALIANSGNVEIQGIVSAAGQLNDGTQNDIAAKTVIDYNTDQAYDPFDTPEELSSLPPGAAGAPVMTVATMLWTRPL